MVLTTLARIWLEDSRRFKERSYFTSSVHEGLCLGVSFVGGVIVYAEGTGQCHTVTSGLERSQLVESNATVLHCFAAPTPLSPLSFPDPPPVRAGLPPAPSMVPPARGLPAPLGSKGASRPESLKGRHNKDH